MSDSSFVEPMVPTASPHPQVLPRPLASRLGLAAYAALQRVRWGKIALFGASILLFVLAITLMKEGASGLTSLVRNTLSITNPANSLGFGWLAAAVIMSGSPVAASALTFFDAGTIDQLEAFTMITGSRLGASLVVLFVGFIYVSRGRDRATSLSMGLLSLSVTGTTYLIGLVIGVAILQMGILDHAQLRSGILLNSVTDLVFAPISLLLTRTLPRWGIFLAGLGAILVSFTFFDKCLPHVALTDSRVGRPSHLVYRPWVMLLLGAGVTLISMSVSVSLSILVPLSSRGFVRRENVIPYIMGANITTFIDTLLAAVLLNNPPAFTIVLVEMVSVTIVSTLILSTVYHRYERVMLAFVAWVTAEDRNAALFMLAILSVPIILMVW